MADLMVTVGRPRRVPSALRVAVVTSFYSFLNRRRGARRVLNRVMPAPIRYATYGLGLAIGVPALWILVSSLLDDGAAGAAARPDPATVASLGLWLLFLAQGTGVRRLLRLVHGHAHPILQQTSIPDAVLLRGRLALPRYILAVIGGLIAAATGVAAGLDVPSALLAGAALASVRHLLTSVTLIGAGDGHRSSTSPGAVVAHVVASQAVSLVGLGLCLMLARSGGPMELAEGMGRTGLLAVLAVLVALIVARRPLARLGTTAAAAGRPRRQRAEHGSLVFLEMSSVVRSPLQAVDFIESLPGISMYAVFGIYRAGFSADGPAGFLVYLVSVLALISIAGQMLEDHFNPVHNRVLRSRQYSESLQRSIATLRFRTLVTILFALTAPVFLMNWWAGGTSYSNAIALLALALGVLVEAAALVFGSLALGPVSTSFREESYDSSAVMIMQATGAGVILAVCLVLERVRESVPAPVGLALAAGACAAAVWLVVRSPSIVARRLLPLVWRSSR